MKKVNVKKVKMADMKKVGYPVLTTWKVWCDDGRNDTWEATTGQVAFYKTEKAALAATNAEKVAEMNDLRKVRREPQITREYLGKKTLGEVLLAYPKLTINA